MEHRTGDGVGVVLARAQLWARHTGTPAAAAPDAVLVAGVDQDPLTTALAASIARRVLATGHSASSRTGDTDRLLAFPAPAGARDRVVVLRVEPAAAAGDDPGGLALAAAHRLRRPGGLAAWQAERRAEAERRLATATAALVQLVDTAESLGRLAAVHRRERDDATGPEVALTLHDTAAQSLVGALRFVEAATATLGDRDDATALHLDAARDAVQAAIRDVRAAIDRLAAPGAPPDPAG
jgi:signal transduction histidine kinase